MIAHIRKIDKMEQSVYDHVTNVSQIASSLAKPCGLSSITTLCGLLHDAGKLTEKFGKYIKGLEIGSVYHSPIGAIYAYERWYNGSKNRKLTAQIISLVIRGHHGGLPDCINTKAQSPFYNCLTQDKSTLCYDEAVNNYIKMCCDEEELDELFDKSCSEVALFVNENESDFCYKAGMLARFILSCIVDGDRWDSASFEYGVLPFEKEKTTDWKTLCGRLEAYMNSFPSEKSIDRIRQEISLRCLKAGSGEKGIYTLNVPTGGGKTLSSLRFALNHIAEHDMSRLLYVIPYNTILEQSSKEIREALGSFDEILDHYGNFVSDEDGENCEDDEAKHVTLTERWESPIILTSMVQFLNAAYKGGNTYSRRFCRLANSVIVFDEIQALPKKCTVMFEKLISFLYEKLGCTIVLCTATQPSLNVKAVPIIDKEFLSSVNQAFDRVRIKSAFSEPEDVITNDEAAMRLADKVKENGSALMIVNTKKTASDIFNKVYDLLPDDHLKIHLSTMMCPKHRTEKIALMRSALRDGQPVCCVSTALIEAGVNISFPCVIRSLAGLPSIIQSAGRCNRHMELGSGNGNVEI